VWLKLLLGIGLTFAVVSTLAIGVGAWRWNVGTREIRARLDAARVPLRPAGVDFRELDSLPAPVQRYLRTVLKDGQPMVTAVDVRHSGSFDMVETREQWKPFTSAQRVIMQRPSFDWDARIMLLPGVPVRVHDAYVAGEGRLQAAVFGLLSVADVGGTREVAEGELMRFFAEATWYPTAFLPSQGVRWEAVDDRSARGTLSDGVLRTSLLFSFGEDGLIDGVRAEARGRLVGGQAVPTPWQGRFWNYGEQNGMRVPLEGEVAWVLPPGTKPYWRGRITELKYELAH
jgi:uncharacterized protein DUF6920